MGDGDDDGLCGSGDGPLRIRGGRLLDTMDVIGVTEHLEGFVLLLCEAMGLGATGCARVVARNRARPAGGATTGGGGPYSAVRARWAASELLEQKASVLLEQLAPVDIELYAARARPTWRARRPRRSSATSPSHRCGAPRRPPSRARCRRRSSGCGRSSATGRTTTRRRSARASSGGCAARRSPTSSASASRTPRAQRGATLAEGRRRRRPTAGGGASCAAARRRRRACAARGTAGWRRGRGARRAAQSHKAANPARSERSSTEAACRRHLQSSEKAASSRPNCEAGAPAPLPWARAICTLLRWRRGSPRDCAACRVRHDHAAAPRRVALRSACWRFRRTQATGSADEELAGGTFGVDAPTGRNVNGKR